MPKKLLFLVALVIILITAYFTVAINFSLPKSISKSEIDTAINQGRLIYNSEKQTGRNFSNGPCLSNALMPGWVLDIAHSPRIPLDDLTENQCSAYVEGKAAHFVELDPQGNLINAR